MTKSMMGTATITDKVQRDTSCTLESEYFPPLFLRSTWSSTPLCSDPTFPKPPSC